MTMKDKKEINQEYMTKSQFDDYLKYTEKLGLVRDQRLDEKFADLKMYFDDKFKVFSDETATMNLLYKETQKEVTELKNLISKVQNEVENGHIKWSFLGTSGLTALNVMVLVTTILINLNIIKI